VSRELPSGTVTFLFTDIESSTRALSRLGDDAFLVMLERHRESLRTAFARHDGYEVGTEGDSFFVAFADARAAVAAAVDAQRALAEIENLAFRVRIGVHTGSAIVAAGDYVGMAVHQAARVAAAAHGGQIVVSDAAVAAMDGAPAGVSLLDLGDHRLKDLDAPHRLYQVRAEGLEEDFPPLRSLELVVHNVPPRVASFVGRTRELADVAKALESTRILTLLGPGGAGKTTLAYQAALRAAEHGDRSVWVAELASCATDAEVAPAVARSLRMRDADGEHVLDALVTRLRDERALLVLDNCEQVIAGAAAVAQTVVARCPDVAIVATSRAPLQLRGEVLYEVGAMGSHDAADEPSLVAASDAVRLFVERAAEVRPGFTAGDDVATIAAICAKVDGLPLAIELAARRVRTLALGDVLTRLEDAVGLLSQGPRDAPARHATLRATVGWSYDLLSPEHQRVFRHFGVFADGAQLDAANAVCGDAAIDAVEALVDQSLLVAETDGGGATRYRMLETIRSDAATRLAEAGEADHARDAHARWCEALAASAARTARGTIELAAIHDRLERERANIDAAFRHLRDDGVGLTVDLLSFWTSRGLWRVALDRAAVALGSARATDAQRGALLHTTAALEYRFGRRAEAKEHCAAALALARTAGDRVLEARCLQETAFFALIEGEIAASRKGYEAAIAIERELGEGREAELIFKLGDVAVGDGDGLTARALYEEGRDTAHRVGNVLAEALAVGCLATLDKAEGNTDAAMAGFRDSLALSRAVRHRQSESRALFYLAQVATDVGRYDEAKPLLEAALLIARDLGETPFAHEYQESLAELLQTMGDESGARAAYEEARRLAQQMTDH
jgi:predicted ATPase/class 3 adenylate cyclase